MVEYVNRPDYKGPVGDNGLPIFVPGMQSFDPSTMPPHIAKRYEVTETGDFGANSGRKRFRVYCRQCKKVLHENTTGPQERIKDHEKLGCE